MPVNKKKPYTEADLALFAKYREQRATARPLRCIGGERCWVDLGPPAMGHGGTDNERCAACKGSPQWAHYAR